MNSAFQIVILIADNTCLLFCFEPEDNGPNITHSVANKKYKMSIDILYFPQKRFHIGCILMKLRYQSFNPIELQLRTEIFYKREPDKLVPADGVYAVHVTFDGHTYNGMLNIGTRPTIGNGPERSIEVNILHFHSDIYDKFIRLSFVK